MKKNLSLNYEIITFLDIALINKEVFKLDQIASLSFMCQKLLGKRLSKLEQ